MSKSWILKFHQLLERILQRYCVSKRYTQNFISLSKHVKTSQHTTQCWCFFNTFYQTKLLDMLMISWNSYIPISFLLNERMLWACHFPEKIIINCHIVTKHTINRNSSDNRIGSLSICSIFIVSNFVAKFRIKDGLKISRQIIDCGTVILITSIIFIKLKYKTFDFSASDPFNGGNEDSSKVLLI